MRIYGRKSGRKNDAGNTYIETMAAAAIGGIILGGAGFLYFNINNANIEATALQAKKSAISDTLNRTTQAIQVADPIILAKPDELVVERKDGSGAVVRTRWVKSGSTLYMQSWAGPTTGYPSSGAWIDPTVASAPAPNGDGTQTSTVAVNNVTASIYTYLDKDAQPIPLVSGVADPLKVRRVDVNLQATAMPNNQGPVSNQTNVSVRNGDGGFSDGTLAAPSCPPVTIDPASTTVPTLNWGTIAGVSTYQVLRNGATAATVNVPSSQPQGSWTEAQANITPGDTVNYQVIAKDSTGTSSVSCRTTTWRVQVATPVLQNSTVLPRGEEASAWSSGVDAGLTQPRVSLTWTAVPGATGYQLLYRALDASGNPKPAPNDGFTLMSGATLDPSVTTYQWDGGSWGTRYEWFVKATSKSGQSPDSRHIQILTHPKTPLNIQISPAYGTGADRTVNGYNNLTWDPSVTAARYEVWRYDTGTSGSASLAGTTVSTSFTDTVPYGSTYTYYVVAKNYGPRGTDGSGQDVTAFRASPNPESSVTDTSNGTVGVAYKGTAGGATTSGVYYGNASKTATRASVAMATNPNSPKPKTATVLQYPPIPVIAAPSLAGITTRDLDGANRLVWAPAKSATSYQVTRYSTSGATVTCLTAADCTGTAPGTTATTYTDPAAKGTQSAYAVQAINATGYSVQLSLTVSLTQRPAAPPLNVTKVPTLSSSASDFSNLANADAGNSSTDRFCDINSCLYELQRNGVVAGSIKHQSTGSVIPWTAMSNPEGATVTWTLRSKNQALTNGGYSDAASAVVNTYPGQFGVNQWIGDGNGNQRQRFIANLTNTDIAGSSVNTMQAGFTSVSWGNSAGASTMRMRRLATTPERTSTDGSYGLPGPGIPDGTWGGGGNGWNGWAAPGVAYKHELTATAPNGLKRQVVTQPIYTPADTPYHGTTIITCSKPTYSWDNPAGHLIGARLIDFQHSPLSGAWSRTNVVGLVWYQSGGPYANTNGDWWNNGQADSDWIAGAGTQYYYGVQSGFDVTTVGISGQGNSVTIRQIMTAYATFHDGCAPAGYQWWDLWEPTYACYGYDPANGTCYSNNPWNRPQWRTK